MVRLRPVQDEADRLDHLIELRAFARVRIRSAGGNRDRGSV
jgi:hypothetical protein